MSRAKQKYRGYQSRLSRNVHLRKDSNPSLGRSTVGLRKFHGVQAILWSRSKMVAYFKPFDSMVKCNYDSEQGEQK